MSDLLVDLQIQSDLEIVSVLDCKSYKEPQTSFMFRQSKKRVDVS